MKEKWQMRNVKMKMKKKRKMKDEKNKNKWQIIIKRVKYESWKKKNTSEGDGK